MATPPMYQPTWEKLFEDNETTKPPADRLAAVKKFFTDAGFAKPDEAANLQAEDLVDDQDGVKWPTSVAAKAMCRRCLEAIQDMKEMIREWKKKQVRDAVTPSPDSGGVNASPAQAATPTSMMLSSGLTVDQEQRLQILGADASQMAMSVAMSPSKKTIDMTVCLKAAKMEGLPMCLRAPAKVWQLFQDQTEMATAEGKKVIFLMWICQS